MYGGGVLMEKRHTNTHTYRQDATAATTGTIGLLYPKEISLQIAKPLYSNHSAPSLQQANRPPENMFGSGERKSARTRGVLMLDDG